MPIKYNLTKYDILAEKFHDIVAKNGTALGKEDEILKAMATLVASFSSAHSWQTYKTIIEGNINSLNSPEVKNEYMRALMENWKRVKNTDIQEVASTNVRDGIFFTWLTMNVAKPEREKYRKAMDVLKQHMNEECDGISIQRQQR